ncbi:MAG: methylmalonyl Co-A mutase-associated GTPase MeaB [Chloroflexi bacterium]|nr:methylmalonyl Co-A mutase-associated GTPase MeaB [Chloroflexota bacterium]
MGNRRATARMLSLVESNSPQARQALAALYPHTGRAHIVGITGPPGSGKSTLAFAAAKALRAGGQTVGIVAVDPSSPFSGGALLGDRIRMQELSRDEGVFIRSMASRGHYGGLALATGDAVKVLDASGLQVILVETVGAGQGEVEIARQAHTTIVVEAPGLGDEIQAIKAGLFEIADIFVVNKADRVGADAAVAALKSMLSLSDAPTGDGWKPPVLKTVATREEGISALLDAMTAHWAYLQGSGERQLRDRRRGEEELRRALGAELLQRTLVRVDAQLWEGLLEEIAQRQIDPHAAAERLLESYPMLER